MKFRSLVLGTAVALVSTATFAADAPPAPPMLVRGTIVSLDAKSVTIKKDDGSTVVGALGPTTSYSAV